MAQMSKGSRTRPRGACCSGLQGLLSPKLFKALSDPKRISLLIRLAEQRGPCTVGQAAEGSGVDLSVVSRHLAILRGAGVIECAKHGKEVWCIVQTKELTQILRDLADALDACCPVGWRVDAPLAAAAATPRSAQKAHMPR